jgi:hypothetical protein
MNPFWVGSTHLLPTYGVLATPTAIKPCMNPFDAQNWQKPEVFQGRKYPLATH